MKLVSKKYLLPFILITSLFFMWGFARAILDVLNKHFQESLEISITQSTLIQATTYLGYFLMALPAGILITRFGYRRGVVAGLLLFGIGALMFIPGSALLSFPIFLVALFVIGCGLVMLETSANPYAAELGDKETAASRLNLAQSFNGLGCILAPVIVGGFLFSGGSGGVEVPYTIMGVIVLAAALMFSRVSLPEISDSAETEAGHASADAGIAATIRDLWKRKTFRYGLLALFCYEVAEISINSLFINYATSDGWMDKATASMVLSFGALGLFMVARVAGSAIMSRIKAEKVLLVCALMTVAGAVAVTLDLGMISRGGVFVCYAFEAIMFPTIFAITIRDAGKNVKIASSFLMMTPIGGAVGTSLMGIVADATSMSTAFIVPAAGYLFVLIYALKLKKQ
ncbi:MAG: MFS transporter [Muribaculaceae bacterium]|nr:MFS transporter [Muribaculaceae bacterium]